METVKIITMIIAEGIEMEKSEYERLRHAGELQLHLANESQAALKKGNYSFCWETDVPMQGELLLGDYKIKVFPNSPLKRLGFLEGYTGLDFWGDGKCE